MTFPDPRGGKKTRKVIKWEMKRSREEGWREFSAGREKRGKKQPGKKTFLKKTAREEDLSQENSQGEDPRTFEENIQGRDLSTLETNSQEKHPRTLKEPVERWPVQKKRKKKKWKCRRRSWWKKCKEGIVSLLTARMKEETKEKEGRKRDRRPRARQVLGKSG